MEDMVVMRPSRGRGLRRPLVTLAQAIQKGDMRRFGQLRTKRLARRFNRHGRDWLHVRKRLYEERFPDLVGPLEYGTRGVPYRLTDEQVMSVAGPGEVHRFSVPKGTVLFIESSACFHFGSRKPLTDRYQVQYAFTSPVRDDFLELWRPKRVYPLGESDSELRRVVLDRTSA